MIFVDTGAWFAAMCSRVKEHAVARAWMQSKTDILVTTDYVINETLTLMKSRHEYSQALEFGRNAFSGRLANIEYISQEDVDKAWQAFQRYSDKGWSFTDCTSKVVMERLGIKTAFAFDQHFRQFGSVDVVP